MQGEARLEGTSYGVWEFGRRSLRLGSTIRLTRNVMKMPPSLARVLFGFLVMLLPAGAAGTLTVTVAVLPLASLLEPDGSGVYQRLMARAVEPLDVEIEPHYYPYRRALQAFEAKQVDCVFSLTEILVERFHEDELLYSYPFGKFRFHIFTPAGEAPVLSLGELDGLSVGTIMGHEVYLESVLEKELQVGTARSDAHAVRMLGVGRFDAIIAAIPDITPFLDQLSYSPEHPVLEGFDRLNCHHTEGNRKFLDVLSAELSRLKSEGGYKEEAGELYVPFEIE